MFKENVIKGKILFLRYECVHSSLTHLNVQGWTQCSKGLVFTFSFLEVSFICTTNWTIVHGHFEDHCIKTEGLFQAAFWECIEAQNSCLWVCNVFLKCSPFVGCYAENSNVSFIFPSTCSELVVWNCPYTCVQCKNNLFSKYLMNFFLAVKQ